MRIQSLLLVFVAVLLLSCESSTTMQPTATVGTIIGKVTDTLFNPVAQAVIYTTPATGQTFSGVDGSFTFADVLPGTYLINASKGIDLAGNATIRVLAGKTVSANIIISDFGYNEGLIKGLVFNAGLVVEPGVTITTIPATSTTGTGPDGSYSIPHVKAGIYKVVAEKAGYGKTVSEEITVTTGEITYLELVLNELVNYTFESLVAYYPFEGNGDDISGTKQHLVLEGDQYIASRFNDSSFALLADGQSTKGAVTHHDIYNVPEITVAAWLRVPKLTLVSTESMSIFSHYVSQTSNGFSLFFTEDKIEWFYGGGGGYTFCLLDHASVADSSWHLVIATANATGSKLFIDGNMVAENAWFVNSGKPTQICPFELGFISSDIKSKLFKGAIDDLRIYAKVLNDAEITQLWQDK